MNGHRLVAAFARMGLLLGGTLALAFVALAEDGASLPAAPPRQMPVSGEPTPYPSTNAYPTTDAPNYPTTDPSTDSAHPAPSAASSGPAYSGFSYSTARAQRLGDPPLSPSPYPYPIDSSGGDPGPSLLNENGTMRAPYGTPDSAAPYSLDTSTYFEPAFNGGGPWQWQILPSGLMYKSYLASNTEPRLGTQWVYDRNQGWLWDSTLGARVGVLRFGTNNDFWPQGWQWDIEGAAFPRLDETRSLVAVDFRAGSVITTRQGRWEWKVGYYHYCSHIGDLYLINNPGFQRSQYTRETLIMGAAFYPSPSLRLYSEAGYAPSTEGVAQPWDFQFGADFCSNEPTGPGGAPFFAINGHLHEENDWGGNLTMQTGWMWRGRSGHLLRIGMQYLNGMSNQTQFYQTFEEQIGAGLWYDF